MLQGDCLPEPKTNENICLCNCSNIHSLLYKKKKLMKLYLNIMKHSCHVQYVDMKEDY